MRLHGLNFNLRKGKDLGKECFRMSYLCLFNDLCSKPRLISSAIQLKGALLQGRLAPLLLLSQNSVQVLTLSTSSKLVLRRFKIFGICPASISLTPRLSKKPQQINWLWIGSKISLRCIDSCHQDQPIVSC